MQIHHVSHWGGINPAAGTQNRLKSVAAVILLIVELDRSQQGWITVGQSALLDLQRQISAP